jgi:hypothetical protein
MLDLARSDDLRSRWGIGFAPEMIASAIMPHILFMPERREAGMTTYLISLSLVGLVVIVLWEGLS